MAFDDLKTDKEIRSTHLPDWISNAHLGLTIACEEYYLKMSRTVYVTPKSYLFFLKSYKALYSKEYVKLVTAEQNFKKGLLKIKEAKESIEIMEVELNKKQIEIEQKQKVLGVVVKELNAKSSVAEAKEREVMADKSKIEKEAAEISIIKSNCEAELAKALPALEAAKSAANKIDGAAVTEWKGLVKRGDDAPQTAKYLLDAMNILLYRKVRNDIEIVTDVIGKKADKEKGIFYTLMKDSWKDCQKLLQASNIKDILASMADTKNADLINDEILELVEPYLKFSDSFLDEANVKQAWVANVGLRDWVLAIVSFSNNTKIVKPKQAALRIEEEKLANAQASLARAESVLSEIKATVAVLNDELKIKKDAAAILENEAKEQSKMIKKAKQLINSLSGERERWNNGAEELSQLKKELVGNAGLATAFISYCGPFNTQFRDYIAKSKFISDLQKLNIPFTPTIYDKLTEFLVDEATVGQWNLEGLPKDVLSIQNGIMVESSDRYPLLIDPQNQGAFWIKNKYAGLNADGNRPLVTIVNPSEDKKLKEGLVNCIEGGEVLIIEGIIGEVDPTLDPVLEKQYIKSSNSRVVKINLGEDTYTVHPKFKLFLTCKLGNPKFTPELSAKTTIIDFTVTQTGLEQQLLSYVLSKEQKVLEESLNALMKKVTQRKATLQELDKQLLEKLTQAEGNLLENNELLDILNNTKTEAKDIQIQLIEADIKTTDINLKREIYRTVAIRGSVMYFCIIEVASVNWMYNSSLNQFITLYDASIEDSKDSMIPAGGKKRVDQIEAYLTYEVFEYVNRGLFSGDKTTFLLMVCFKIMITAGELTEADVSIFLKVGAGGDDKGKNSRPNNLKWLIDSVWKNTIDLSGHKFGDQASAFYKNLPESFVNSSEEWEKWFARNDPENAAIPEFEDAIVNDLKNGYFLRFILIRSLKPDRTIVAANTFIKNVLKDNRFIDTPSEDTAALYGKSAPTEPVLFLLSEGADPSSSVYNYAMKIKKQITSVSLGEGQGEKAEAIIREYMPVGNWILLQNCHLGLDFMEYIDNKLNDPDFTKDANEEFRIWMSCEPHPDFPLGLLQRCLKVANEPPKGIKAGLRRTFKTIITPDFLEKIEHPTWRILCYVLSFLHSLVVERRKFGSLGWCIRYEYNDSDLEASLAFIEKSMNQWIGVSGGSAQSQNFTVHYDVIKIMVCDIQYGGKVSDNVDRELFKAYGDKFLKEAITGAEFSLCLIPGSGGGDAGFHYKIPSAQEHTSYCTYIESMPTIDSPEVFSLSVYADIACRNKETKEMLDTLTETRPKEGASAGGMSREQSVQLICQSRSKTVTYSYPQLFINEKMRGLKGPKGYPYEKNQRGEDNYAVLPLNIFLQQELQRMERIIGIVRKTLNDVVEAVDGSILMTPEIVDSIDCIHNNRVPRHWLYDASNAEISWMKFSFSIWFESFKTRNEKLGEWLKGTRPRTYNLDNYFNPQGLLTSMKQENVRIEKEKAKNNKQGDAKVWSMDFVDYSTKVVSEKEQQGGAEKDSNKVNVSIWVEGLKLEGCRWSKDGLADANEKTLIYPMPIVEVGAMYSDGKGDDRKENEFLCPVYKYPTRTDKYLIIRIPLKSGSAQGKDSNSGSVWQLKGVALLCYVEQ